MPRARLVMLFVVDGLRPDSITAEDTPTLHRLRGAVFHLLFELAHPRADGTTHLLRDPLELIEKIALLIPPPRFHTLRCHGVRGPCAGWRSAVKREDGARAEPSPGSLGSPSERSLGAALLRRVVALDVVQCPRGGGRRRIVGVHTGGERLRGWLERLGLDRALPSAVTGGRGQGGKVGDRDLPGWCSLRRRHDRRAGRSAHEDPGRGRLDEAQSSRPTRQLRG